MAIKKRNKTSKLTGSKKITKKAIRNVKKVKNTKVNVPKLQPKKVNATVKAPKLQPKKIKQSAEALEREAKKAVQEALKLKLEEEQKRMRKVSKILSDAGVRQNLIEIGGENALAMVRNFHGNNSDDDLAKKLKIKISDVRATLNKLHNEGLVNYIREKDSETGWYSYSWTLNHERIEKWANTHSNVIGLNEGSDYYFCPACGTASITSFESASGIDFRCERCNRLLEFIDEKKLTELYEKKG